MARTHPWMALAGWLLTMATITACREGSISSRDDLGTEEDGGELSDGDPGSSDTDTLEDAGRLDGAADGDAGTTDTETDGGAGDPGHGDSGTLPYLGQLVQETETPEQIGLVLPLTGAASDDVIAAVRYRVASAGTWQDAHPLLRIHPEWIAGGAPQAVEPAFAGTIFDLTPGTAYDVEVTVTDPALGSQVLAGTYRTRALPGVADGAVIAVTPANDLQTAFDALQPGQVLELGEGAYDVDGLQMNVAGTATQPITIRGATRDGVIIRDSSGTIIQLVHTSHVVFERFTLEGSGTDSGTEASSTGFSFWDGAVQEYVTVRNLVIRGVDKGVIAWGPTHSALVYDNDMHGNNLWNSQFVESNLTWNDDGIRLPGTGNCAFHNTLHGFGDTFAVNNGVFSAAVHYYRNKITMTGDDAFEGDYGTRNLSFYDNHISNSATFLSLDPLWGGPLYCFRNVMINTYRGPFKFNNTNSGHLVYNNTIIRTQGSVDWGWVQYDNGDLRNWTFRNNILIYRGAGGLLALESGGNDPIDFTHNAWYPDGSIWWSGSGGSFSSLAEAFAGLPATTPVFGSSTRRHEDDHITVESPFVAPVPLGADWLTEISATFTPVLSPGAAPKNSGLPVSGITDGYSGAAPDRGAIIEGRDVPSWGRR